jgi:hypothetical protein
MALGSAQPLKRNEYEETFSGGKERPTRKDDNLMIIYKPTVYKMWEPQPLTNLCASRAYYKDSFTFF